MKVDVPGRGAVVMDLKGWLDALAPDATQEAAGEEASGR